MLYCLFSRINKECFNSLINIGAISLILLSFISLLSLTPNFSRRGNCSISTIQAQTHTGPKKSPVPTSSEPACLLILVSINDDP